MVDADPLTGWEPGQTMSLYTYIGCYTDQGKGEPHRPEGIILCKVDAETGRLDLIARFASNESPSFLRLHPNRKNLYAVNELVAGKVSAFEVDPASGALTVMNSQPTDGAHPCYISYDPSGKFALISNYSSGSLAVFPIGEDGRLAPHSDLVVHGGSGPNKGRQERPHAHSIAFDPSGKYAIAADLGIDRLLVYRLDSGSGKLVLNDLSGAATQPGAGPRHFTFHPNGGILYCGNEVNNTVTVCTWDSSKGILVPVQVLPTLPADFIGESTVADIHLNPAATRLYVSNRGHNSLAVFAVRADGTLSALGQVSCGGNWPRNFAIDPSGTWLFAANQYSNDVVTFRIDGEDGMPRETGQVLQVLSPVCLELVEF